MSEEHKNDSVQYCLPKMGLNYHISVQGGQVMRRHTLNSWIYVIHALQPADSRQPLEGLTH